MRPEPAVLEGRYVRLEPFAPEHLPGLFTALWHPEVFAGGYGGGPAGLPRDREAFDVWASGYGVGPNAIRFVVRLVGGPHDGDVVGASTLGDLDEEREHAHIGWTGYDPRVWATQVNPETKLLMLGLAFSRGYGRVKLQADDRNARSRGACRGARSPRTSPRASASRRADGSWRDSAVYSILIDEWPAVKAGLEARLQRFDGPVLFHSVP